MSSLSIDITIIVFTFDWYNHHCSHFCFFGIGNRTGVSTTLLSSNVMPFSPFILDYGPSRRPPIQSLDLTISSLKAPPPRRLGEITNYSWSSNLTQTFTSRSRAPMVDGRHSRLLLRYTSASTSDKTGVPVPTTPIHAPAFPQIVRNYLERNINQQNRAHNINLLHPRSPKLSIITQSLNLVWFPVESRRLADTSFVGLSTVASIDLCCVVLHLNELSCFVILVEILLLNNFKRRFLCAKKLQSLGTLHSGFLWGVCSIMIKAGFW